jgi:GAF domain-containing protein
VNRKVILQYALIGALFGLLFPLISIGWQWANIQLPFGWSSLALIHAQYPFQWMIDTAPVFLGFFAAIAGKRQADLLELNNRLERSIQERDELVDQLEELQTGLELDIAKRVILLKSIAQVASQAAKIQTLEDLLAQTVCLISDQLGYYHVGIFLLDETCEYAVLQASNSEGGRRMLAHGHRLRVGEGGIVGIVAREGQLRIASDVGLEPVYFNNRDLPLTRSEIAMPMKIRGRIIGVLDFQSTQPAAFSENDANALQILADQLALAIENARLLRRSEQTMKEIETLFGSKLRDAWHDHLGKHPAAFRYNRLGVLPLSKNGNRAAGTDLPGDQDSCQVEIPIMLRGQKLGVFRLIRPKEDGDWRPEEEQIIHETLFHVGLALENARLLEETQQQAEQERMTSTITSKIWSSPEVDTIIRTTLSELGRSLRTSEGYVQLEVNQRNSNSDFKAAASPIQAPNSLDERSASE